MPGPPDCIEFYDCRRCGATFWVAQYAYGRDEEIDLCFDCIEKILPAGRTRRVLRRVR